MYKQEKDRGNRRPPPLAFGKSDSDSSPTPPPRANGRRPSLHNVHSIVEDEEDPTVLKPNPSGARQATSPPSSSAAVNNGITSLPTTSRPRKSSRAAQAPIAASEPTETLPPAAMNHLQSRRPPPKMFDGGDPYPSKTRRVQKNRESLDLDDVMAGSDDENIEPTANVGKPQPSTPSTPRRQQYPVSASTRDLMDFLAQGPPDATPAPPISKASRDLMTFLDDGPPDSGMASSMTVSMDSSKSKGSGRLQRMMSKLSMGTSDKPRSTSSEDFSRGSSVRQPTIRTIPSRPSQSNMSALANRPIPPRPPPVSPPLSPSQTDTEEYPYPSGSRPRQHSVSGKRTMPTWEQKMSEPKAAPAVPSKPSKPDSLENGHSRVRSPSSPPAANGHAKTVVTMEDALTIGRGSKPTPAVVTDKLSAVKPTSLESPSSASRRHSPKIIQTNGNAPSPTMRKPAPSVAVPTRSHVSEDDSRDMRRMITRATTADECRLIVDMFLAKAGISMEPAVGDYDVPYPSPSSEAHMTTQRPASADTALEHSLVELFLGSEMVPEAAARKRRSKKRVKPEVAPVAAVTAELVPSAILAGGGVTLVEEDTPKYTPVPAEVGS